MEERTKEELTQTPKKKHRWLFIVYSVLCILSIINCVIYVSPKSVHLCLTLWVYWGLWIIYQKTKLSLIAFVVAGLAIYLFAVNFYFTIFCSFITYRHPWQYEKEMANYRQYERYVSYFPETIPDCATDVSLRIFIGAWQAKSYINLSFIADDAYIQKCKEKHMEWYMEYENIEPEADESDWESTFSEIACVDLYDVFNKYLNQHYTPEAMRVLSISEEDALNRVMQWLLPHNIHLTEEELRSAKQYHICEDNGQGFIIVEDTNRIIFYKDNEH